jgi:hypothetical protein
MDLNRAPLGRVITDNELPEMRFIDRAYITGEIANTLIIVGDSGRAKDFAQESIASSLAQGRARRGSLSNVALAETHVKSREIEGACKAGRASLLLNREVDSARTIQALRRLKRKLARYGGRPEVKALLDEMNDSGI